MAKKKETISLDDVAIKDTKAGSKNPVITAEGEQAERIIAYNKIQAEMKVLKNQQDSLGETIRSDFKEVWTARALEGRTENLKIVAGDEGSLTFIVMDSYAKVTSETKSNIEAAGLGEYVEKDQIQLVSDLTEENQTRILKALIAEFGKEKAFSLVETQYKVRKGSLLEVVSSGSKKMITAAFDFLRPTTQLR